MIKHKLNIHDTTTSVALNACSDIGTLLDKAEGTVSEEELREVLKRYNLRNWLIMLGQASNKIFSIEDKNKIGKTAYRDPRTGVFITQFGLAYLANLSIISASNDYKAKNIDNDDNFLALCNIYSNKLVFPEILRDDSIPFTKKDLVSTFVRMHWEQFEYQFHTSLLMARIMVIFRNVINALTPDKFEPLSDIFERETSLSLKEYFILAMTTWSASHKTATFRKEVLTEAKLPVIQDILTENKVESFLKILSVDYKTFRDFDVQINANLVPELTKFRFNPLQVYPIIKTDRPETDPYVIPNSLCFIKKAFGGLYWWFHSYFENLGTHIDFRTYYGKVFEEYVGMVLKHIYGDVNVHPEIIYPKGKFVDWWVESDNKIYLFEVKAYQFPLATKQTGDLGLIVKEVKFKITEAKKQIFERISEINQYEELKVFRGKELIPVVVFWEMPFISTDLYKELIEDELDGLEKEGLKGIKNARVYMMNIEELELYEDVASKITLDDIFRGYENKPGEGFLSIVQEANSGVYPRSKYLGDVYRDFSKELMGDAADKLE